MPSEAQARVSGTVTHREQELATGEPRDFGPVPDVLISVRGLGSAFDAWTDDRGRYEVAVPPGKYTITAVPPAGFSSRYLHETTELRDPRACFVADFGVRFDGRIRGVVRPSSGERAEGISVELMAADDVGKTGNIQTLHASTDAGGSFEFSEVSPGRYRVGVDLTRRMDAEVIFPRTFYPGTPDAALATVIQMSGGQQRELEPMTLPPARHPWRLTGTVVFEDGSPASGAFISLSDGSAKWRQVAVGIRTEVDGTFSFVVHQGLSYIANASYRDELQRKQLGGSVGPFVITEEPGRLKVVLSGGR